MNLKQAHYIKTIAECGGITAAAKKLYVSQPSLSQMLRHVEEELGVEIFDRSIAPFHLTYAGEKYLHAAQIMLPPKNSWKARSVKSVMTIPAVCGWALASPEACRFCPW